MPAAWMTGWRLVVLLAASGVTVGLAAVGAFALTIALIWREHETGFDVRCPRCDPERSILDVVDGRWLCLDCGYSWRDPSLPRKQAQRDVHFH